MDNVCVKHTLPRVLGSNFFGLRIVNIRIYFYSANHVKNAFEQYILQMSFVFLKRFVNGFQWWQLNQADSKKRVILSLKPLFLM